MDIQQNNVAVLHFNLVNQDGSTIFIRKTKLATFNLINPSAVSVPITDIGFDATLNQCWIRVPKASNAATGQYYGVLNIVDDDWGTYTTSKIKVYSVVSDADEDTKSVVFTATCIATQVTNPSGGNSPYYNATTGTWWQYSDTLKAFEDTGVGNLIKYITKNVQHLKDGTGNGSIVTCLDDEISANNIATGLCSTDLGKNNDNGGESCVALGENNYIAEGVSNATAIAGAQPSIVDVFAVGDKTVGHKNVFVIDKFGNIHLRPDSSQERTAVLQDILDHAIKNVIYDSSKYSLTVTFYSAADNANKIKTYDLSGLKAVLKDDAVKEISVNQATAVMTVDTINGSSQQIQLPATKLATARNIGLSGVTSTAQPFDGSANITIPITAVPATLLTGTASISTTGNAATATKLANARTINIAGASTGSVSFDGSSDVTINAVRRSCSVGQAGGTTTNPWYKVASCSISDAAVDMKITFQVNGWWSSDDIGILSIRVRTSGSKIYESSSIVWEVASNGIKLGDFVLAHNTGVTPAICELWVNIPFANYFYKFNVIEEGNRTANYNAWTLYDLSQAGYAPAPTSGYALQASTLATIKNNAATATKLATARSITLSGNTTGTATFDGSDNITIDTSTNYAISAAHDDHGNSINTTYATKTEMSNYLPLTGNAATATKATQDGSGNEITSTYLPLSGGTLAGDLRFSDSGFATKGIYGTVGGGSDFWRVAGGASATDAGWLELATADNGHEPIYARQYSGVYNKIVHSATLLDENGNTSFPGTVTACAFLGNAATSSSSNYIKSNTWNWSGVGPQGTGFTVKKIASITDMSYLEIDGGNLVGGAGTKGIVKISIAYIDGIITSNSSTASTSFGYVITSTTGGNSGKVNIDLYLQEIDGENYYNILVSKLVGSAISFESPSAAAITAPSGYVAIS